MFAEAGLFNADLSRWDIRGVSDMTGMFHNLALSTESYDALLNARSKQAV